MPIQQSFAFIFYSSPRKKSHSHGSQRIVGPLCKVETHTGHGWHEEKNQDNQIVVKSCMERDHYVVSMNLTSLLNDYCYFFYFFFVIFGGF